MPVSIILQSPPQNPPVDPWRLSRIRPSIGLTKHKLRLILAVIEHFLLYYVRPPFSGHFVQHASLGRIYRRFVLAEPTERPPLSLNVVRPSLPVADPTDLPDESLN